MEYDINQAIEALTEKGEPKITLNNILRYVELGELDMYVYNITWKLHVFEHKDEISLNLKNKKITSTTYNEKIEKAHIKHILKYTDKKFFKIPSPLFIKPTDDIGRNIYKEVLFRLGDLRRHYEHQEKNEENIIKIDLLNMIASDLYKDDYASYNIEMFMDYVDETKAELCSTVSFQPTLDEFSEKIKFSDVYFLSKDIQKLKNKFSDKKTTIELSERQEEKYLQIIHALTLALSEKSPTTYKSNNGNINKSAIEKTIESKGINFSQSRKIIAQALKTNL